MKISPPTDEAPPAADVLSEPAATVFATGEVNMSHLRPRKSVGQDLRAGLTLGVESIPDGLAAGLLAGVNPVCGLYGYLFGTVAGALATSSVFMTVQATGAMAVIIADIPAVTIGPDSARALFTLSLTTGLVMLALGLLRMGRLVRFISNAVLTGFINAVAVTIVLGQLPNLTGYESAASTRVTRSIDTFAHVRSLDWQTLAIGLLTIGLILLLERTRLGALGLVVAVVVASAVATFLGLASVKTLSDIATIPSTLPHPTVPDLGLVPAMLLPALSLALVGLVQGAAISSSMPNPDGRYPDASGDFRGQGIANVVAGVFQGMPVAGSMSATSLVTVSGARSRLANLTAGLTMAVLILTVGGFIGQTAMAALAGLLILIGIRTFKWANVAMAWRTGPTQATVMVTTFVLTLLIPLQYAVLVGVGRSVVLYVASQSNGVAITRWVFDEPAGLATEAPVPAELPAGETFVLQPYGSLFFAAAPVFERQLPRVTPQSTGSVVIIRLRGEQELGSTFISVIARYFDQLDEVGSLLMLAGLGDRVYRQLETTRVLTKIGSDHVFTATPLVTESLRQAFTAAQVWRAARRGSSRYPADS